MRSMCTHVQEIAAAELAVHALEARKHLAGVVPRSSSLVEGCVVVEGGQKANVLANVLTQHDGGFTLGILRVTR